MASYSTRERVSHVARRLGFGVQPELLESRSVDEAIAAALDLSPPPAEPPFVEVPSSTEEARSRPQFEAAYRFWLHQLVAGPRRIEERMAWFWHDHFSSDLRKVRVPYLMLQQHLTIRRHATGSFADLLHQIAVDPAMLIYLDGVNNAAGSINENFGREVMELFTIGRGSYTEDDVMAASRAFSGWVVAGPENRASDRFDLEPWTSVFVPFRHDAGTKTLLGVSGQLGSAEAIDVLLDHPSTAELVAAKLYEELVGLRPDPPAVVSLAAVLRRDYQIMDLVQAIAADPRFVSDESIRTRVRTPLEKAIGVAQAFGLGSGEALVRALEHLEYVPYRPPNVGGFPSGARLLGPHSLIHTFDLVAAIGDAVPATVDGITQRLGLFDLTSETRAVLNSAPSLPSRVALAINSPEYHVV